MTVTSFYFLVFLLAGVIIYYVAPKKMQWIILLILSLVFYYFAATPYTIVFLVISTVIAYFSTNLFCCEIVRRSDKGKKIIPAIAFTGIAINIVIWFILKGSSFWTAGAYLLRRIVPTTEVPSAEPFVAALGMGYYTAQVIGYILDCYWEIITPQKNPLKLFLFVCFFPQLTVGPISKYSQLQGLYEKHKFKYENLCLGSQRILWGFFKKLVISGRIAVIVNAIWANTERYTGFWSWIAVFLYPLEIYTDFSGCVDVVLGAAELFDIKLPENFNNPFMARTVQEFWQRWHMSLGAWAKDYVYYPVLKSKLLASIGRWCKRHFKKRIAKFIPWAFGMGVLWLVMGFWHGSIKCIIGVSAWYWCTLILGELFSPVFKKAICFFNIDTKSFSWHLLQSIRTYVVFSLGAVFFAADSLMDAAGQYQILFHSFKSLNPWIFFNDDILKLGVTWTDINLLILGVYFLSKAAYLRENYGYARTWVQKQILPFRWFLWIGLFLLVLIYGLYGPGYDASQFIYQGF